MAIYEYNNIKPVIDESSFVHPLASVIGNVIIGKNVFVGSGASIRGDFGGIVIKDGCNVQENCQVHMFPGVIVTLEEDAHIGHGAIIHGAKIGRNTLIGMGAIIMDDAEIGDEAIVGALCFVPSKMIVPPRKVVVGNPAKIIKDVSDEMLNWKIEGTKLYQELPEEYSKSFKECEPLRQIPDNREIQYKNYNIWQNVKK
jgi:carbonic anhydrase/acetyltransferase-like protein (isoleucine patch superfamily)